MPQDDWFSQATTSAPSAPSPARGGGWVDDPYKARAENRADRSAERQDEAANRAAEAAARAADAANRQAQNDAITNRLKELEIATKIKEAERPLLTAKERADALAGYQSSSELGRIVKELKDLYAKGPGATSGVAGLQDYFPSTAAKRFDTAGNKARGTVGQALGFTGGQLNTAAEASAAVGPYLPQSSDRDAVILDKIASLEALANDARTRSIAVLGGEPDANGKVKPIEPRREIPAAIPAMPQSSLGPGTPSPVTDPSGNREFSTEVDKAMSSEAQAAFNAGASREQIDAIAAKYGAQPFGKDLDAAIATRGAGGRAQFSTPASGRENAGLTGQILGGMASGPLGAYAINSGNALTAGGLDEIVGWTGGNPALAQVAKDFSVQENPYSSLAGMMTGGALGTMGASRALGAVPKVGTALSTGAGGIAPDVLYGGLFGAGESNDGRLTGALMGAGASGAGNIVGRGMFGGLGRAARGVSDPAINYLKGRGVPLTFGQMAGQSGIAGRAIKGIEDKLESVPYLGDSIRQRREEGFDAFGGVAIKDALEPINQQVQGTVGNDAIEQAQGLISDAYANTLGPVRLTPDAAYRAEIAAARAAGGNLPGPLADTFKSTLANRVDPFINGGNMSGRDLQAAIKGLRMDSGSIIKKSEPMADLFKDRTVDVEGALMGLAERQAPGTGQGLRDANSAYRNLSILEDATLAADNVGGRYTPAQLGRSMINNTKRFGGKRAAAAGDMPFRDLQSAGQSILPSTTPNTGTNDRALATWLLPTAIGGAAATGDLTDYLPTEVAAPLGLAGLATTKAGRAALEKMLLSRPETARSIGNKIYDNRRIGGMFGSPLLLGYSQGQ